jgi:hypothetical protein
MLPTVWPPSPRVDTGTSKRTHEPAAGSGPMLKRSTSIVPESIRSSPQKARRDSDASH